MRLAITGGGTGGHVFPALEVARLARAHGHELLYLGSLRGQEGAACQREGIAFQGFSSEPVYSVRTARGMRALAKALIATARARTALKHWKPDVLFSTGGYSAAPVVNAARILRIPYVLLEANSVPGRSNLMFAKQAKSVATVFRSFEANFPGAHVVRTGMPIRQELRAAAKLATNGSKLTVLIVGGSQGSEFLNKAVPQAAAELQREDVDWLHVAGKGNDAKVEAALNAMTATPWKSHYKVVPFLQAEEMAKAYAEATVVVGRSGGSLAELALFGVPSVLVPLPSAAGDHQTLNAGEFVAMGAATLHPQGASTPKSFAQDIAAWLENPEGRKKAREALKAFDDPKATDKILKLIEEAAR